MYIYMYFMELEFLVFDFDSKEKEIGEIGLFIQSV